jgi:hypothetical protein
MERGKWPEDLKKDDATITKTPSNPVSVSWILLVIGTCIHFLGQENKFNYAVATQDRSLAQQLNAIPGVPLVQIHQSVYVMSPPSEATLNKAKQVIHHSLSIRLKYKRICQNLLKKLKKPLQFQFNYPKREKRVQILCLVKRRKIKQFDWSIMVDYDPQEKELVRRLDLRLVPMLIFLYFSYCIVMGIMG